MRGEVNGDDYILAWREVKSRAEVNGEVKTGVRR